MYSYEGLKRRMAEKRISKTDLAHALGMSSRTVAKITKGEKLSPRSLQRIADYLGCEPQDLGRELPDNPVLQRLREEKEAAISGGLYHELQIRMTYNSNHIEGSTLSEDQTRLIFETQTLWQDGDGGIPIDDILETVHHFRAIDYVIDHAEQPLTEQLIKELHYILKHDTRGAALSWFAVGDYKKQPNMVGGRQTAAPKEVPGRMRELLQEYESIPTVTIRDIISFHAAFERIHPFQDGNGRVGRLIALKECLRHNIVPFIIEDHKKMYYYRGLAEWDREKGYLTDTCLDGQDTFRRLLELFDL